MSEANPILAKKDIRPVSRAQAWGHKIRGDVVRKEIFEDKFGHREAVFMLMPKGTNDLEMYRAIPGMGIKEYELDNGKGIEWLATYSGKNITVENIQIYVDGKGLAYTNVDGKKRYMRVGERKITRSGKDVVKDDTDKTNDFGTDTLRAEFNKKSGGCAGEGEIETLDEALSVYEIDTSAYGVDIIPNRPGFDYQFVEYYGIYTLEISNKSKMDFEYTINGTKNPIYVEESKLEIVRPEQIKSEDVKEIPRGWMPSSEEIKPIVYSAHEFTEDENPIVRCIMDPAFRKLYGAMYGFVEGDEYFASRIRLEKTKKEKLKLEKASKTKEKIPKTPIYQADPVKIKMEKLTKEKTPKKPIYQSDSIKKEKLPKTKGKKIKTKTLPIKLSKDSVKERKKKLPRKNKQKPRTGNKRKPPKNFTIKRIRDMRIRRFAPRIQREIENYFRLAGIKSKEIKVKINMIIQKVKEYFKLKELVRILREKLDYNWIFTYSKLKIQKMIKNIEIKLEKLKLEIKNEIKSIIKTIEIKLQKLKINLKNRKEALRVLARILLIYFLVRIFTTNKIKE